MSRILRGICLAGLFHCKQEGGLEMRSQVDLSMWWLCVVGVVVVSMTGLWLGCDTQNVVNSVEDIEPIGNELEQGYSAAPPLTFCMDQGLPPCPIGICDDEVIEVPPTCPPHHNRILKKSKMKSVICIGGVPPQPGGPICCRIKKKTKKYFKCVPAQGGGGGP
jgi:hypothetical protein